FPTRRSSDLLKLAPHAYDITIIGDEPHPNYNRIMLSSVLAGSTDMKEIVINDWDWYKENGIKLVVGEKAVRIDTKQRQITTQLGKHFDYDRVIIATGSQPFMLPIAGSNKEGVIAFRNIKDCETMLEASKQYKKAVVIGGGLLGLEAARGLIHLGMETSVVHIHDYLMERQLDEPASRMLQRELEAQGMTFLLNKQSAFISGRKRVKALHFTDGSEVQADLIVMAVGIRPNVELAKASGIDVNRGIIVNDEMETNLPGIYAVGECAEHRGIAYGLVAPLYEQGMVLAKRLAGIDAPGYQGSVTSTKLKVSGVDVFSAGSFIEDASRKSLRIQDDLAGTYKKITIDSNGKLIGAVLFGDTSDGAELFSLIKRGEVVEGREKELLLGISLDQLNGGNPAARYEAMPDDEIVCGCNGVTKATIVDAIHSKGCNSVSSIKACTKASGSCGGCKPIVEGLLSVYAGDAAAEPVKEGICGCTILSRD